MTLGEIGPILTAVWISYVGSYGNRPRWMGIGMLIIAAGLLLGFSMNWIFPPPPLDAFELQGYVSDNATITDRLVCHQIPADAPSTHLAASSSNCTINSSQRRWAFAAWVLVYSLLGKFTLLTLHGAAPFISHCAPFRRDRLHHRLHHRSPVSGRQHRQPKISLLFRYQASN